MWNGGNLNKNDMKKSSFIVCFLFAMVLFTSCSVGDYDILEVTNSVPEKSWNEELSLLLKDNASTLSSSGISLKKARYVENANLSIDDFFGGDADCYPVYSSDLSRFDLKSFDYIEQDTSTMHYKTSYLKSYVDSLLRDNNSDVVELVWSTEDGSFHSFALIDSNTGEIQYENVLFNMLSFSSEETGLSKQTLTRTEGAWANAIQTGHDEICCVNVLSHEPVARVTLDWAEFGDWIQIPIYNGTDSSTVIGFRYQYHHISSDHRLIEWSGANSTAIPIVTSAFFLDMSTSTYGLYKYMLWAGYYFSEPVISNYPVTLTEPYCFPDDGTQTGFIKMVKVEPKKYNTYN